MRVPFVICDVFTDTRFGGNPLAVITDARGVSDADMLRVAREFGFSETTFVLPPDEGDAEATHRVRIFTPVSELPFAGHPNVGTAFVLASTLERETGELPSGFRFREGAGLVPVSVSREAGGIVCELRAPEPVHVGETIDVAIVANAVGLDVADISSARHPPRFASVGLSFAVAELVDRAGLARACPDPAVFDRIGGRAEHHAVLLHCRGDDEGASDRIDCRMFCRHVGVDEDPATGSANGALAGLLATLDPRSDVELAWRSRQGDDMGRPSRLALRAIKRDGAVSDVFVGGRSVAVADGWLRLDG